MKKKIAQLDTLFALSNFWMLRAKLMEHRDECARNPRYALKGLRNSPKGVESYVWVFRSTVTTLSGLS